MFLLFTYKTACFSYQHSMSYYVYYEIMLLLLYVVKWTNKMKQEPPCDKS